MLQYYRTSALVIVVLGMASSYVVGRTLYLPDQKSIQQNGLDYGEFLPQQVNSAHQKKTHLNSLLQRLQGILQGSNSWDTEYDPREQLDGTNYMDAHLKENFLNSEEEPGPAEEPLFQSNKRSSMRGFPEVPPEMLLRLVQHLKPRRFGGPGFDRGDVDLASIYNIHRGREDISIGLDLDTLTHMIEVIRREDKVRSANQKLDSIGRRR